VKPVPTFKAFLAGLQKVPAVKIKSTGIPVTFNRYCADLRKAGEK
jgi:hypothetical protein